MEMKKIQNVECKNFFNIFYGLLYEMADHLLWKQANGQPPRAVETTMIDILKISKTF